MMKSDYEKFAISNGISSLSLHKYNQAMLPKAGYISPTVLEERELNVVGYDIFSRLMVDRIIFLGDTIDSNLANIINSQLLYLNSVGNDDIKIFINSPGGSVIDGLSIIDLFNFVKPDISTYCMGMCASMASVLLSSGTTGKRFALPNSEIMLHQASGGTYGKNVDIQIAAKHIQRLQDKLYGILAKNCNKTIEEIEQAANNGDNWFDANGALEFGLVDKIITTQKEDM
jgi:ATP-dependent Clp protease protease subunit